MRNHRRLRRIEGTVGKAFVMCMIIFFLLNLIVSDKEMSEEENRMLAGSPRLSWSSLVSGDFMTKYETYLADQFAGRNFWRSIKVGLSGLGGSRQEEDILIGKDDYLMEEIVSPDQDTLMENLEAIRQFAKRSRDIQTYMLLVPNAANIMRDRLPAFATVSDQSRMFAQVKRELGNLIHPQSVKILKLEGKKLEHNVIRSANGYFLAYAIIFAVSLLLVSLDGFDMTTNMTAVAATFNNIGPGLAKVGPTCNWSGFSAFSKYVFMFDMLAGRLEIFPMLLLFSPGTWKKGF